jgi:hypothetical protein
MSKLRVLVTCVAGAVLGYVDGSAFASEVLV